MGIARALAVRRPSGHTQGRPGNTGGDILYVIANAVVEMSRPPVRARPVRLSHHGHGCLFHRWNHGSRQFHPGVTVLSEFAEFPRFSDRRLPEDSRPITPTKTTMDQFPTH